MWDGETRRDFWLASDGAMAVCLTLAGLSVEDAVRARLEWDSLYAQDSATPFNVGTVMTILNNLDFKLVRVS